MLVSVVVGVDPVTFEGWELWRGLTLRIGEGGPVLLSLGEVSRDPGLLVGGRLARRSSRDQLVIIDGREVQGTSAVDGDERSIVVRRGWEDDHVSVVDAVTGSVQWSYPAAGPLRLTSDLVLITDLAMGGSSTEMHALERSTGLSLWSHAAAGSYIASLEVARGGAYALVADEAGGCEVVAIDLDRGRRSWSIKHDLGWATIVPAPGAALVAWTATDGGVVLERVWDGPT